MKMPLRSTFPNSESFMRFLNEWIAQSESAFHHLRGMFDATEEGIKPNFQEDLKKGFSVRHVELDGKPSDEQKEVMIRNLSGNLFENNLTPVEVFHGNFNGGCWSIYAVARDA